MQPANTAAIETHGLAKGYRSTQALHPLTLTVPTGAVFALVGHNGAGKTTLIKLLMNMIHPSAPAPPPFWTSQRPTSPVPTSPASAMRAKIRSSPTG